MQNSGCVILIAFHCNNGYTNGPHCYVIRILSVLFFLYYSVLCLPTHCRCRGVLLHLITLNYTHTHTWLDSSGRRTRRSHETDIHAHSGVRTRKLNKRATADPRLKLRGPLLRSSNLKETLRQPKLWRVFFTFSTDSSPVWLNTDWWLKFKKGSFSSTQLCLVKYTCPSQCKCVVQLTGYLQVCYTNYINDRHCLCQFAF